MEEYLARHCEYFRRTIKHSRSKFIKICICSTSMPMSNLFSTWISLLKFNDRLTATYWCKSAMCVISGLCCKRGEIGWITLSFWYDTFFILLCLGNVQFRLFLYGYQVFHNQNDLFVLPVDWVMIHSTVSWFELQVVAALRGCRSSICDKTLRSGQGVFAATQLMSMRGSQLQEEDVSR